MGPADRPVFLFVEDNEPFARSFQQILRPLGDVVIATTRAEGLARLIRATSWSALFIDVRLPDGSGLDVLRLARRRSCAAPALVLTSFMDPEIIAAAFDLDAQYLVKGDEDPQRVVAFATRAVAPSPSTLANQLERWVGLYGLTATEARVLLHAANGMTHDQIALELEIGVGTLKTHIKHLLSKTGERGLVQAALRLVSEK